MGWWSKLMHLFEPPSRNWWTVEGLKMISASLEVSSYAKQMFQASIEGWLELQDKMWNYGGYDMLTWHSWHGQNIMLQSGGFYGPILMCRWGSSFYTQGCGLRPPCQWDLWNYWFIPTYVRQYLGLGDHANQPQPSNLLVPFLVLLFLQLQKRSETPMFRYV